MKQAFATRTRFAIAAGLLVVTLSAAAQPPQGSDRQGRDGQRGDRNPAAHMSRELGLTTEQTGQVEAIFEDARSQRETLGQDNTDAHCALRADVDSQLQSVLTTEQWSEFQALKSERSQRRQGREADGQGQQRRGRGGPPDCNA